MKHRAKDQNQLSTGKSKVEDQFKSAQKNKNT